MGEKGRWQKDQTTQGLALNGEKRIRGGGGKRRRIADGGAVVCGFVDIYAADGSYS